MLPFHSNLNIQATVNLLKKLCWNYSWLTIDFKIPCLFDADGPSGHGPSYFVVTTHYGKSICVLSHQVNAD